MGRRQALQGLALTGIAAAASPVQATIEPLNASQREFFLRAPALFTPFYGKGYGKVTLRKEIVPGCVHLAELMPSHKGRFPSFKGPASRVISFGKGMHALRSLQGATWERTRASVKNMSLRARITFSFLPATSPSLCLFLAVHH